MQEILLALLLWLGNNTDIVVDNTYIPEIILISPTEICKFIQEKENCSIVAFYYLKDRSIYLPDHWSKDNVVHKSILLHELVHHFQHINNSSFQCSRHKEKQAYKIQFTFLEENGIDDPKKAISLGDLMYLVLTTCSMMQF